ncbi:MAG: MFS transporter [Magnetococcales bacterium]|nr:MFS transporter [Magnetococcales bacterium]
MNKRPKILEGHLNTLLLLVALVMILMTLILATQPLFLRQVLALGRENAGFVNANIQVATEVIEMVLVGYLGYLSDRFGRIPIMRYGFLLAAAMALIIPFCGEVAVVFGVDALAVYYLSRVLMSLGTTAVWPQLSTMTGDYSTPGNRTRILARAGFMTAFGATLVYAVLVQLTQHVGVRAIMLLAALVALAGAWLVRDFLVENAQLLETGRFPLDRLLTLLKRERALRLSFLAAFASRNDMVVIGLFLMTWFIYFSDLLPDVSSEAAAGQAGFVIGFIGVVVLISIPVWGAITERQGPIRALIIGLMLSGVGFLGFGFIVNPLSWWSLLPALLVGLGQAGCILAPQILVMDHAEAEISGSVMGAFNTAGCIGIVFFLQVGGILFDWIGPTAPFLFTGLANLAIMVYGLLGGWYAPQTTSNNLPT